MSAESQKQLQMAAARLRRLQQLAVTERLGWIGAGTGLACYLAVCFWPNAASLCLTLFLLTTVVLLIHGLRTLLVLRVDELKRTALALEAKYPELQARLLTAVEQRPDLWTGRYNLLQQRLLNQVAQHAREQDWSSIVPGAVLAQSWLRQAAAITVLLIVGTWLITFPGARQRQLAANSAAGGSADPMKVDFVVDPGHTQVERNSSLLVLLRFPQSPPRDATLHWLPADGMSQHVAMTKSLDDPVFAGRLASVGGNGVYRLEFDGVTTDDFSVTVYDLPALRSSSITVIAPPYTHREPQLLENATAVTVIEGSQVRLECRVNKPLARVELRNDKDDVAISFVADGQNPLTYVAQWSPERSRKWQLMLTDADGRTNRDPLDFQIDVVPNRRPDLKPVFPGQDQRVSALQELALETRASDDFGILSSGIVINPSEQQPVTVPLTGELSGGEAHALTHLLALESFLLEPGEIVSYTFFADDYGPDGEPRRTMSDLFFLEIRPFDESYREMEGAGGKSNMQGASGGPAQQLDKLIDLQKQIVTAAWNLQRRDPDLKQPSEQAAVETLVQSQSSAHEQFEKLSESLAEAVPAERIRTIFEHMSRAIEEFTALQSTSQMKHLDEALVAARGAFQGLVRLRPKDHRIMKGGQSGGGAGGGGSTSQQQLEQLELSDDQNRYETEKSARNQPDTAQQKEQLAFLNRLKELAQRQQGLNEKLKELDAELRTAQTQSQKDELERQLKQLRDEQQDLLQDADALRNKLEQSKNSDQTADTRKQLEQTRQQLVDATESLKEGKLGQALSSGTRAEKDLQKMQDDFRKKSSAQLAEALQQLRNQAKELTETEERAAKELAGLNDRQDKSLRQRQQREKLAETFQEQREKLAETLKNLRQTVDAAESSEPLAAKRLYEAARKAQQQKTEQALNAASQLIRQGFLPEASQVEELARGGLQTLRDGIEEAAESVLGDELADLKRAKRELAELSQELQQEISTAQGKEPTQGDTQNGESSESGDKESKSEGQKPGNAPGSGKPEGEAKSTGEGESPAEPSEASESNSPSENPGGEGSKSPAGGKPKPGLRGGRNSKSTSQQPGAGTQQPSQSNGGQGGGPGGQGGPLTGGNYSEFVDRLRDVETLLNDPELQAEVAKVREQARSIRADFKRHSVLPNWDVVEEDVRQPLVELQRRIAEEIARRESPDALVPTDRDPVPQRYRELVRKYYERLGGGGK